MERYALGREQLIRWIENLVAHHQRVLAPVRDNGMTVFQPIRSSAEVEWNYGRSDLPLKEWVFPRTEPILYYRFGDGGEVELKDPEVNPVETVVLFARPCDAVALKVLDAVFRSDVEDPFYLTRRQALTIVGLACIEPQPECFCPSVGLSPVSTEGSDILLTPIEGRFLVEVLTERGRDLVNESASLFTEANGLNKGEIGRAVEARMTRCASLSPLVEPLNQRFESEAWEEVARRCLGCGVCAYVCPTCHCFDIVDEADAFGGCRCKNWDCCAFGLFTRHASGHNPRPTQAQRYRQRVMHKFCYFLETFGQNMCVGCGRCVAQCPVQLDIYEVVRTLTGEAVA